jgi:cell division protein FtsB
MNNENLIKLRSLRDEEKALKRVINDTKEEAIAEAFLHVPNGGTFTIEGVKYTLKLNPTIDLTEETGKFARAWQKKSAQRLTLQEQIDALKAQQNMLDEEMDKLVEKHIASTAGSDHPYTPKTKPSIAVL